MEVNYTRELRSIYDNVVVYDISINGEGSNYKHVICLYFRLIVRSDLEFYCPKAVIEEIENDEEAEGLKKCFDEIVESCKEEAAFIFAK